MLATGVPTGTPLLYTCFGSAFFLVLDLVVLTCNCLRMCDGPTEREVGLNQVRALVLFFGAPPSASAGSSVS
jgi:hypothetical protein